MIFSRYLTDTNQYILETNIISKKYRLNIGLIYFLSYWGLTDILGLLNFQHQQENLNV